MGNDGFDFLRALCSVYKTLGQFFFHTYLFKERYINSAKSYKYLNKLISKCKNNGLNFFKNTMYLHRIPLIKL